MYKYIISDTRCLILFEEIGEIDLLQKTYGEITTTKEVLKEYRKPIPNWVKTETVKNVTIQKKLEKTVDKGEASAIALALELKDCILIIDDKRGRKLAIGLKLELTGTLGTLLKAKQKGIIPAIKPLLNKIKQTNFRISTDIEIGILRKAGE